LHFLSETEYGKNTPEIRAIAWQSEDPGSTQHEVSLLLDSNDERTYSFSLLPSYRDIAAYNSVDFCRCRSQEKGSDKKKRILASDLLVQIKTPSALLDPKQYRLELGNIEGKKHR
jgi:hypothetical protein